MAATYPPGPDPITVRSTSATNIKMVNWKSLECEFYLQWKNNVELLDNMAVNGPFLYDISKNRKGKYEHC